MIRLPAVAIIFENSQREVLLLLRDDKTSIFHPNQWLLVGGKVEDGETVDAAAHREMFEEIGIDFKITFWKRYDRQHPKISVDQYIYVGRIDLPLESLTLAEGQDMRFFKFREIKDLRKAFEFDTLLNEYFQDYAVR